VAKTLYELYAFFQKEQVPAAFIEDTVRYSWVYMVPKNQWGGLAVDSCKNPEKSKKPSLLHAYGDNKPRVVAMKFCIGVTIHDVSTCVKFGEDQLRDLNVAIGQISGLWRNNCLNFMAQW